MAIKTNAKNVEIYICKVLDTANFLPGSKGNNVTLASYMNTAVTGADLGSVKKLSDFSNEVSVEPVEDTVESKMYFGSTATGSQNSETQTTINSDVDVTIKSDYTIDWDMSEYALSQMADTHATVNGYKAFSIGATATTPIVLFIRIKKVVGSTYYFKNFVILNPVFKKAPSISGSSEDTVLPSEVILTGNKSQVWFDYYNDDADETLSNFT